MKYKQAHIPLQSNQSRHVIDLVQDCLALFLGNQAGHMEKWEYNAGAYNGDLAGGAEWWAQLVAAPGNYYPAIVERALISNAIKNENLEDKLSMIRSIIEFGPGSENAIANKTLPFLSACPNLAQYIAIDGAKEQADGACQSVSQRLNITTKSIQADFTQGTFKRTWEGPAAYIMWGCTVGNLPGHANQNPFETLTNEIKQLQKTLLKGDMLVMIFDANADEESVLGAYNEPALKRQSLSWLHGLKRDGIATGNFDPRLWVHEPVWFSDVMQCAHTVFPMFDQAITIAGHTIEIPAWRRFVSNNSYKFKTDVMIAAAEDAGLKAQVLQHGPMAMLIAEK